MHKAWWGCVGKKVLQLTTDNGVSVSYLKENDVWLEYKDVGEVSVERPALKGMHSGSLPSHMVTEGILQNES